MRLSSGVLVAALVTVTAAQRPGPEFNLFSQLDSLRSNLLSLLGSTLTGQPQPRPPPSRPASFSQPPPRPPPRRPAPFPRPPPPQFSGSPNLNQLPPSQPRPIQNPSQNPVQIQNPAQNPRPVVSVQPVLQPAPASPAPASTFPIVEVVPNNFDNTLVSEQLVLAPAPDPAVPAVPVDVGPASFIDSERVNAVPSLELDSDPGTEDTADTSINILQHIPEDLWREDIEGIDHHKEHQKKIRITKRRKRLVRPETSTPADPALVVE